MAHSTPAAAPATDSRYSLTLKPLWATFKAEGFAFWMACAYVLMEFIRPQAIYPWLDIFPWTRTFVILALVGHFFANKGAPSRDAYNIILPVFLLTTVVSCVAAYHPAVAFDAFAEVYSWVIIYFMVSSVVNTERRLWLFTLCFFLACAKLSVFCADVWVTRGFSFASWGVSGPPGYFQNSGELSLLMCMFFSMSYAFWIAIRPHLNTVRSWILLSLPVTAAMTVLASSTRGSQLALVVQIVYFAAFFRKLSLKGILYTVGVGFLLYALLPAEQLARFQTAGTDETSVARLTYWAKGMEMLNSHPLTGIGLHNFPYYFHDFFGSYSFHNRLEVAHNSFVQVGSELGYPGLALFIVIILRSFFVTAQARKILREKQLTAHWLYVFSVGLDCAMIGYCIGGFFMAVAFYPYVWIHIAFCVSLRSAARSFAPSGLEATTAPPTAQSSRRRWYPSYAESVERARSSMRPR